jgi:hypothetical protein
MEQLERRVVRAPFQSQQNVSVGLYAFSLDLRPPVIPATARYISTLRRIPRRTVGSNSYRLPLSLQVSALLLFSRTLGKMSLPAGFRALPLPLAQLSLDTVLACGQSFRWFKHSLPLVSPVGPTHEYRFALQDRVVCLRQTPDTLLWRSQPDKEDTLDWLKDYFQLNVDLQTLYNDWAIRDTVFDTLVKERFKGLRMLRQDPWENLIS